MKAKNLNQLDRAVRTLGIKQDRIADCAQVVFLSVTGKLTPQRVQFLELVSLYDAQDADKAFLRLTMAHYAFQNDRGVASVWLALSDTEGNKYAIQCAADPDAIDGTLSKAADMSRQGTIEGYLMTCEEAVGFKPTFQEDFH